MANTKKTVRTDCHRPGAIIPANYRYVWSYNLATSQDGWPIPSYGVNCEARAIGEPPCSHKEDGFCCLIGLYRIAEVPFVGTGGTGRCSICGAAFIYGDVWQHVPTGEYLHVGHTCAHKYEMLADRSEYELQLGRIKAAAAKECQKAQNAEERKAFLDSHPGLEEALKCEHHVVQDIAKRFQEFRSLSDKQIALVHKLAEEAKQPKVEEKFVPAPEGRVKVEGLVVGVKSYDSAFGTVLKMTVKVETPEGNWLCWGTVPSDLLGNKEVRGSKVRFTATLTRGRDAHFALFKRPAAGSFVE